MSVDLDRKRRKSLYAINEESKDKFAKEIKQDNNRPSSPTPKQKAPSYTKRRSPRAERQSKKFAAQKTEVELPANLEKSISEGKEEVVTVKRKLEKSNSVKVKKTTAAPDTKNTSVTKFAGTTDATNSTHSANQTETLYTTTSSNSALTATVSALKEQPETLRKRSAFGSHSFIRSNTHTVATTYEPRKSLGAAGELRTSFGKAGSSECNPVQKPDNLVAKARKAYQHVESKARPQTSKSVPKGGIEKKDGKAESGKPAEPFSPGPP